jgi:hypothetical protein
LTQAELLFPCDRCARLETENDTLHRQVADLQRELRTIRNAALTADQREPARAADPETSHVAARKINITLNRWLVWKLVSDHPSKTAMELLKMPGHPFHSRDSISPRLPELERLGAVIRGVTRPCSVTGETTITWVAVTEPPERPKE